MLDTVRAAIQLTRPAQWIKNVFVFPALVFAHQFEAAALLYAAAAFVIFCVLSGAVYAFNDLFDYRQDAQHPTKRLRPVARGAISPNAAGIVAIVLIILGTAAATRMPPGFLLTTSVYLVLNLFYTVWGKHRVLLDVILIAIGFVLRALGGAQAVEVDVSVWLVICTFTLCLFLGFGKRRCELDMMDNAEQAATHRPTLAAYTPELLTQLLSTTGGLAVVTFLLYTLDPNTPSPRSLVFTTPLVFYAIFRYAMLIGRGQRTGPTDILIKDRPFLATAVLWTALTLGLILGGGHLDKYLPRLRYPGTPPAKQPGDRSGSQAATQPK